MKEYLQEIKEQLFDAPSEVKEAFNEIVSYFDKSDKKDYQLIDTSSIKYHNEIANNIHSIEKSLLSGKRYELRYWDRDYKNPIGGYIVYNLLNSPDSKIYYLGFISTAARLGILYKGQKFIVGYGSSDAEVLTNKSSIPEELFIPNESVVKSHWSTGDFKKYKDLNTLNMTYWDTGKYESEIARFKSAK